GEIEENSIVEGHEVRDAERENRKPQHDDRFLAVLTSIVFFCPGSDQKPPSQSVGSSQLCVPGHLKLIQGWPLGHEWAAVRHGQPTDNAECPRPERSRLTPWSWPTCRGVMQQVQQRIGPMRLHLDNPVGHSLAGCGWMGYCMMYYGWEFLPLAVSVVFSSIAGPRQHFHPFLHLPHSKKTPPTCVLLYPRESPRLFVPIC
ncbi:hypothetical protein MAPG_07184, partial [Magnaporthiopsis poae ATCC 64411]